MMFERELLGESLCLLFGFFSLSDRLSSVLLRLSCRCFLLLFAVFSTHYLALNV